MSKEKIKKSSEKEILEIAKKRFKLAEEAEIDIRKEALEDVRFRAGEQWPDEIKMARSLDGRPCLTINKLPQHVRQVTNDQRQNRPAIKVSPVDDKADKEIANVLQGIVRHIEYNSNADVAYDTAFEGAVVKGFGYFRVITDYVDPASFEQEIKIKPIRNHFTVYLDPHAQEPDGSDINWGFVFEDISHEDYKEQYKNSDLANMSDWESVGDSRPNWVSKDTCRIAEYFYKTNEEVEIVLLNNKEVLRKSDLPEILPEGIEVVAERTTQIPLVKWCKMNAVEILEETDWPGQWIPIIPVYGDIIELDGKLIREGIIRHARDPQRMYNYWATSETETIALAPKAPFIGAAGQFEGFENQWKTANVKNHAYLEYNQITIAGQPAPAPQRNSFEAPVAAITNARMQSIEDLKSTTGIYDASLGNRSNETSGVAIRQRTSQSQTSNFHFVDNLSRSLRHLGRILVDLIPKVYDTPRAVRIIGEDREEKIVYINQVFEDKGKPKLFDLSLGKYDVTVSTGPSYATKRQEMVDTLLSLVQSYPQMAQFTGDLLVKNMDFQGGDEIAERLKRTIPPEIIGEDKEQGNQPIPPQVQAQMQQMNQMVEQLTQQLNQAQDTLSQKSLELQSKERIEELKLQLEYAKLEMQGQIALLKEKGVDDRLSFQANLEQMDRMQKMNSNSGEEQFAENPEIYNEQNLSGGLPLGEGEINVDYS